MNKVMTIVKGNLISVIALALGVIAFGVLFFLSSGMNAKLRKTVSDDVSKSLRDLTSVRVPYEIPTLDGGEGWSRNTEPNPVITELIKTRLEQTKEVSEEARAAVLELNSAGRDVLVSGLFPEAGSQWLRLSIEMIEEYPRAHAKLLERYRAGSPPSATELNERLTRLRDQLASELVRNREDQTLTEVENEQIRERLTAERIKAYQSAAQNLGVYADASVFKKASEVIPGDRPTEQVYQRRAWDWQHAYWVHQDAMGFVALANRVADGGSVLQGPVKRVASINVLESPYTRSVNASGDLSSPLPKDFATTPTGRIGGNGFYDVRYFDIDMIVDASRLNEVVDAVGRQNLMSVVDLDYRVYDPAADVRAGYFYGTTSLLRVKMRVESIWIRQWLIDLLPPDVRSDMGLPDAADETGRGEDPDGA